MVAYNSLSTNNKQRNTIGFMLYFGIDDSKVSPITKNSDKTFFAIYLPTTISGVVGG